MILQERVDSDLKEAMRAKDTMKLGVLRMLKSALKYAAIAKSDAEAELDDAEAAQVIRKQARQRQDSIESFEKAGRTELAEVDSQGRDAGADRRRDAKPGAARPCRALGQDHWRHGWHE